MSERKVVCPRCDIEFTIFSDNYGDLDDRCPNCDSSFSSATYIARIEAENAALKRENEALRSGHKRIQEAVEPNFRLSVEALVAIARMAALLKGHDDE